MYTAYKNIAIQIKGNLLAELKIRDIYSEERKKWFDKAFEVGGTDRAAGEECFKKSMAAEMEANIHNDNIRHLRYALANMLDILAVNYDTFHPETAEF